MPVSLLNDQDRQYRSKLERSMQGSSNVVLNNERRLRRKRTWRRIRTRRSPFLFVLSLTSSPHEIPRRFTAREETWGIQSTAGMLSQFLAVRSFGLSNIKLDSRVRVYHSNESSWRMRCCHENDGLVVLQMSQEIQEIVLIRWGCCGGTDFQLFPSDSLKYVTKINDVPPCIQVGRGIAFHSGQSSNLIRIKPFHEILDGCGDLEQGSGSLFQNFFDVSRCRIRENLLYLWLYPSWNLSRTFLTKTMKHVIVHNLAKTSNRQTSCFWIQNIVNQLDTLVLWKVHSFLTSRCLSMVKLTVLSARGAVAV